MLNFLACQWTRDNTKLGMLGNIKIGDYIDTDMGQYSISLISYISGLEGGIDRH